MIVHSIDAFFHVICSLYNMYLPRGNVFIFVSLPYSGHAESSLNVLIQKQIGRCILAVLNIDYGTSGMKYLD